MKTHVCLVSAQAAANLLPALDAELKPEKVVLVVSGKMKSQADHVQAVFKNNGIQVEQWSLNDEHSFASIEASLLDLAAKLDGHQVALNITGGTKLMSIAAQSVAVVSDWQMFYVDVDTDKVSWLERGSGSKDEKSHALKEQLRLRHYLQSYGFSLLNRSESTQITRKEELLIQTLIKQIGSLEAPLATLNWLAQQAEDAKKLSIELNAQQQDSRSLEALIRNFSENDFLTVSGNKLIFTDTAALTFVKGGWLESFVIQKLHEVTGNLNIRDKAANLELVDHAGVKSELDAAFMARNRLFVIECKTARMDKPEAPKANDTLFKLAGNCRRIGGLGTKGMLVSYRSLREPEKKLAKALGIEVVSGLEISRLAELLKSWVH